MRRHIPGLHSQQPSIENKLEGLFLVRIDKASFERELGIITPAGYKQMNALTRLAGAIAREELKRRKRNRDGSLGVRKTRTDVVGSFISQSEHR
jgi:hypothetical protein